MTAANILRERILTHGLGIASSQGLQALSMGDLARDLDLSRSGLLEYFASKEILQLGVIDQAAHLFISDVINPAGEAEIGEARLKALFGRWISWSRSPRLRGGCPFVHASAEGDTLPGAVRDKLSEFLDSWSATLKSAIEEAKAAGKLRSGLDADQLAFELYGLYLSHHFWHWSMKDRTALDRTMKAFDRLMSASR